MDTNIINDPRKIDQRFMALFLSRKVKIFVSLQWSNYNDTTKFSLVSSILQSPPRAQMAKTKPTNTIPTIPIAILISGYLTSSWWPQKNNPQGIDRLSTTSSIILRYNVESTAMTYRSGGNCLDLTWHRSQRSQGQRQGQSGGGVGSSVWNSMNRESRLLSSRSLRP